MRIKRPDFKDAQSLLEAARKEMAFTLQLVITPESASTIIRNIYECFRMLGEALLTLRGIESTDHLQPVRALMALAVETKRPLPVIDTLRKIRHNINYYGYQPGSDEAVEAVAIAQTCFEPLCQNIKSLADSQNKVKV